MLSPNDNLVAASKTGTKRLFICVEYHQIHKTLRNDMHSEMETNTQLSANEPPVPPPAHFDLEHVVTARPVQPLSSWQRSMAALRRIFGPHVIAVAVVVAGSVIGFTVATSALDVATPVESANQDVQDVRAGTSSGTLAERANVAGEVEPATPEIGTADMAPPVERTLTQPVHRIRRTAPPMGGRRVIQPFEVDEDTGNQRPRPRLVSIIH